MVVLSLASSILALSLGSLNSEFDWTIFWALLIKAFVSLCRDCDFVDSSYPCFSFLSKLFFFLSIDNSELKSKELSRPFFLSWV
jgi:hypothetical protein